MNLHGLPSILPLNLHGAATVSPMARMKSDSSTGSTGATSSTSSAASAGSINSLSNQAAGQAESTFISLLVTELQSQDPTSPMDPTNMVSQMFSMNQLQQLININQTLTAAFPAASASGSTGGGASSTNPLTGAN